MERFSEITNNMNINKIRTRNETQELERDEKGNVILTPGKYNAIDIDIGEYASAHAWISLKKINVQCLVKNQVFDIEKVLDIASEKTETNIPDEAKVYFKEFYSKKKNELEQIFKEVLQQKSKGDEEICV